MSVSVCRPRCAACCIAPSITSPLPGMPQGKPAGVPCVQLDEELGPDMPQLVALIDQLPPPECHYTLQPMDDSAGPLVMDKKLQSLFAQWEARCEFAQSPEEDVDWLQRNPLAFNCFEILDDWLATDDMAPVQYGTVLALFMDKQEQAALGALKTARAHFPEIGKMLLADKPKQPRLREGLVQVGGKDEAWFYRQDNLDLWQSNGGLDWLANISVRKSQVRRPPQP